MPSRTIVASSGTRRATSMSVARSSTRPRLGGQLHAGERLDGAAGRGHAGGRLQLREEFVRGGLEFHGLTTSTKKEQE